MIREIINSILINIAKQYPINTGKRPINMFAFMEDSKVLTSTTFEKIYIDYVNNKFWSRDWEQEGADPSTMRREYPFMTLENVSVTKENINAKCSGFEFWVMIGDQLICKDCPERSEADIYSDLYEKANQVMMELYSTYEWTNGSKTIYATKKYVDYWQSLDQLTDYKKGNRVIDENLEQVKISATNLGIADNVVAVSFRFMAYEKSNAIDFNYDPVKPENLIGFTKCESC